MVFPVSGQHGWTVRQILVHTGLFSGTRRLNEEIVKFHARQNIFLTSQEIISFYGRRQDGVAFDAKDKQCVFLEFTCLMDSVTSSDEGDWAERKELEKRMRDTECTSTLSTILASSVGGPGIAHKPTCELMITGLSQEDPIPRQSPPSRADRLQARDNI